MQALHGFILSRWLFAANVLNAAIHLGVGSLDSAPACSQVAAVLGFVPQFPPPDAPSSEWWTAGSTPL